MNYYDKYKKMLILKDELQYINNMNKLDIYSNNSQIGGNYNCNPTNKYSEICIENQNGKYKTKEGCINDCERQYIDNHLNMANLKNETTKFYKFIKDLINQEHMEVYIKGGNALGLKLLRLIYKKYSDSNEFDEIFNKFLDLKLIKDWDFAAYSKKEITPEYRKKLDKLAKKHKLSSRASTFILYQTHKPILIEGKALYEISILNKEDKDAYSKLEIPITTMKVKMSDFNIKYIFMFSKSFLVKQYDMDIIKKMLELMHITIHPHKSGMYNTKKNR